MSPATDGYTVLPSVGDGCHVVRMQVCDVGRLCHLCVHVGAASCVRTRGYWYCWMLFPLSLTLRRFTAESALLSLVAALPAPAFEDVVIAGSFSAATLDRSGIARSMASASARAAI